MKINKAYNSCNKITCVYLFIDYNKSKESKRENHNGQCYKNS